MRGNDYQQSDMFSYLSPEQRVRKDHPLRAVRAMTEEILERMSPLFDAMYASGGRPSIAPEKLLRAQLLQMLYSVRSERLLMEEIDYSILYRWFVGLNLDEAVWDATTFTKNRDRLLEAAVAKEFLAQVVEQARVPNRDVIEGCESNQVQTAGSSSKKQNPVTDPATPGTEFVGHSTGIEPQMRMRSNANMSNIGQTGCESCFYIYLNGL
jgi:transposase